jgi:hypothetical protein
MAGDRSLAQRLWAASTPGHPAIKPAAIAPAARSTAAAYLGLEQRLPTSAWNRGSR